MKFLVATLIALFALNLCVFAQSPEKLSYQAIIRNNDNQLLPNQQIAIKVSVLQGSATGTVVYTENHTPQTNSNGLVTIEIGTGTTSADFSKIDWGKGPYYIKTDIDPTGGTNFTITATSQLLSVPYALYAKTSDSFSGDMKNTSIVNLGQPVNPNDAVTKDYVDALNQKISNLESLLYNQGILKVVIDIEGNQYGVIKIGDQVWMTQNLRTTTYNDGTPIKKVTGDLDWANNTTPSYCWYFNDSTTYASTYGAFYNFKAVQTEKLCPSGWHVPSDSEWTILSSFVGGEAVAAAKLKEAGTEHWNSPNTGALNAFDFKALPGGYRLDNGIMGNLGRGGYWWSSNIGSTNNSWGRCMSYVREDIYILNTNSKGGFSVRCVKD